MSLLPSVCSTSSTMPSLLNFFVPKAYSKTSSPILFFFKDIESNTFPEGIGKSQCQDGHPPPFFIFKNLTPHLAPVNPIFKNLFPHLAPVNPT